MVLISRPRDGVALLEMGEPEQLNLWSLDLERELFSAIDELVEDADTRVMGLVARGKAFCAGADIGDLQRRIEELQDEDAITDYEESLLERRLTRLLKVPKPVVAGVNGACVGVGLAIALTCDIRFAADDVVFKAGFPQRGLIAEHGLAWLLPRIIGIGDTLDLLLTSRSVRADEALAMRLVSRITPPGGLRDAVADAAARMAATVSPRSMAIIKQQVYRAAEQSFAEATVDAVHQMAGAFRSPDATEGVSSFVEKRPPQFPPLDLDDWR